MSGIKLHHPELRSCTYTLIHEGRPLQAPTSCFVCGLTHHHKTYHLGLDAAGDVVVSETVFQNIEEAGLDELEAKSEIKKPAAQRLDMARGEKPVVVSREGRAKHSGKSDG